MDHPAPEGRGRYEPFFRFMNMEAGVIPGTIRPAAQFGLQLEQIVFQPVFERGDVCMAALALGGPFVGPPEVFPGMKPIKHRPLPAGVMALHQGRRPGVQGRCYSPAPNGTGAAGSRLRHFSPRPGREQSPPGSSGPMKNVGNDTRNPVFLFLLSGLFLLRIAQRRFLSLLLNAPPRKTRVCLSLPPQRRSVRTASRLPL